MDHPLSENEAWEFWKPKTRAKATFLLLDKDAKKTVETVISSGCCREVVLSSMKVFLFGKVMKTTVDPNGYSKTFTRKCRIRLLDPDLEDQLSGSNQLQINEKGIKPKGEFDQRLRSGAVEEFLQVADMIVGIPSVLLSHRRPQGEWWKTDPSSCKSNFDDVRYICWNGSDNWFLRHPALLSIASGLIRQAAMLTACGFGPEILNRVPRKDVEAALTTSNWKLAFGIAKKLRPWIEVPVGAGGCAANFPFSLGQWERFDRLQRAQRKHNYQKIFGGTIYDSWGLNETQTGGEWTGGDAYWGVPGSVNAAGDTLMKLGKPRGRLLSMGRPKGAENS